MKNLFDSTANFFYRLRNFVDRKTTFFRLSKLLTSVADFFDSLAIYGVKHTLLALVWEILSELDKGEYRKGETAPYCGHAYSGFENKYIYTSFVEGDGGGATKFTLFGYRLEYWQIDKVEFKLVKK